MSAEPALSPALARLESRWGSAAVRIGLGDGAGAHAPAEAAPAAESAEIVPTGFGRLDELLGSGGLPRGVSAAFRGGVSSGKTALALHCVAQAQARGAIVAFLDLARAFDPIEAQARGVDLRWLLVCRPQDAAQGWALAAALVSGRQVDLIVIDLPAGLRAGHEASLRRLAAHARRQGVRMIVLEPLGLAGPVHGAVAESVGLRLELEQRGWLRAGRDIVGRQVSVSVAKNRFGVPGRQAQIEIRYLADGEHSAALERFGTAEQPALPAAQNEGATHDRLIA